MTMFINNSDNENEENQYFHTEEPPQYTRLRKTGVNPRLSTRDEDKNFIKVLALMFIVFFGVLASIFILADNKAFLAKQFGEESILTKISENLSRSNNKKEKADFSLPFGAKRQNILLLGIDSNGEDTDLWAGTRSDTIILLNIDSKTKTVNAISIPRDSKVYLAGRGSVQKINAAHAIGGIDLVKNTIEETLGIKIDKYVIVHDDAVRQMVKALGGVNIYVEKDMKYNDYAGHLHINLTKGQNRLDADEVIGYLRFRHDVLGDIGRTQRQQWFLKGLLEELKRPQTIAKIPELISVAHKYVKTDMSVYEMSQYAALAKHFDVNRIEIATLPGAPNKKGFTSYWILDPEKTQEVVNRLIYREKPPVVENAVYKANVMYAESREEDAEILIAALKEMGVEIGCTGFAYKTHSQFIAHSNTISNEYYNSLKKKIKTLDVKQFVYEPINVYCGSGDYTIILSSN